MIFSIRDRPTVGLDSVINVQCFLLARLTHVHYKLGHPLVARMREDSHLLVFPCFLIFQRCKMRNCMCAFFVPSFFERGSLHSHCQLLGNPLPVRWFFAIWARVCFCFVVAVCFLTLGKRSCFSRLLVCWSLLTRATRKIQMWRPRCQEHGCCTRRAGSLQR